MLGLGTFAVYLATLAPTISWRNGGTDGPELAAAAYVWGVAHPPGYPTYLVALKLVESLPMGDVAFRANLFSALAAAAAAVLLYELVLQLGVDRAWPALLGASFAAAVLAFGPLFWSQAVVAEIYTFGVALLVLVLLATTLWLEHPTHARTIAVGLALALAISHHPPYLVTIVPIAGIAVRRRRPLDALTIVAAIVVLVPALFLTLWLRASFHPPLNWGDPSSLDRWLRQVQALDYRPYFLARPLPDELPRIPFAASLLVRQGGWLALGLAGLGFTWLWSVRRPLALLFGLLLASFAGFAVLYNAQDSQVYLLPAIVVLAITSGLGAAWLLTSLPPRAALVGPLVLAASVGWQVWAGWPEVDAAGDWSARTTVEQLLTGAPANAVAHSTDEAYTFTLWYLRYVEGQRPDVAIVDDRLLQFTWYRDHLLRLYPQLRGQGIAD